MITIVFHIIILLYCLAILALIYGFSKVKPFESNNLKPKTRFSIIVPFRNEGDTLPKLLNSFSDLNYPPKMFEIILVDDDSEKAFSFQDSVISVRLIKNIRKSNSPKKDAITTAMQVAQNDWIITTDADCIVHKNWISTLDNYIQLHAVSMIAGPVTYACEDSFLHHFQQLDFTSLQGATIGSFGIGKGFMCNGANFAYKKSFFEALNGFEGNNTIASGDDVFLLQKALSKSPEKVYYLKSQNTIVTTNPVNEWEALFYQRVRWASKTGSYQSSFGIVLGLIVFSGNLSWLLVIGCSLFGYGSFYVLAFSLASKLLVDFALIQKTNAFLKTKTHFYFISSLCYPFFSVGVALYSLFGKYEWKGRSFSK